MTPLVVMDREQDRTKGVQCGKCPNCVSRRTSGWSFRLSQQEKVSESSHFITLTYDTTYVPFTDRGYMSLDFRDCQLFLKRLRKAHPRGTQIKYYLVGEYGAQTDRPHYHVLFYNTDIKYIQNAWQNGQVHYGTITGGSIGYCLKYLSKPRRIPMEEGDDRTPERALMSKGLGANYLSSQIVKYHRSDLMNRMYLNWEDGRKLSMPRYYKDKLYTWQERNMIGEHLSKMQAQDLHAKIEAYGPNFFRDKAENDRAAFKRMGIKYLENQIL